MKKYKKSDLSKIQKQLIFRSKRDIDDTSIMERLEDSFHKDLTPYYGSDESDIKKMIRKLRK